MKTEIIKIGNGLGVIIPPDILHQLNLSAGSEVTFSVKNGTILINHDVRKGWADAAEQMIEAGDDELLISDLPNEFDDNEWTWKENQ